MPAMKNYDVDASFTIWDLSEEKAKAARGSLCLTVNAESTDAAFTFTKKYIESLSTNIFKIGLITTMSAGPMDYYVGLRHEEVRIVNRVSRSAKEFGVKYTSGSGYVNNNN